MSFPLPSFRARNALIGLPLLVAAGLVVSAPAQSAEPAATGGLYPTGTVPKLTDAGDAKGVELGVRFKSTAEGVVEGVRFYKDAANAGVHTGSLWSETGAKLSTATFANESATGWQTVRFADPVTVKAGSSYVASYYAPRGRYAMEKGTFAQGKTLSAGPLTATSGLYAYGRGGLPTFTWQGSSYFVEPLFTPKAATTTPAPTPTPTVTATPRPTPTVTPTAPTPTPTVTPTAPTPTPTPTVTPTAPTPTPTTPPTTSGFPTEANTGPTGTLTAVSGSVTTSAAGQVIKNQRIAGDLVVSHANVTLQNSHVQGRIRTSNGATNLSIVDSEVGSNGCASGSDYQLLSSSSVSATRSHFHGGGADLIRVFGGSVTLKDSLVNGGCEFSGDHFDAVQMYGPGTKANVTIDHSTIDGRSNVSKGNAAVFWADEPGAGSTLTITNSQLSGGNFTISLYDAKAGSGVFLDVRNNTFVKGTWQYGPCAATNSIAYNGKEGVRFTGNKLSDGSALATCG